MRHITHEEARARGEVKNWCCRERAHCQRELMHMRRENRRTAAMGVVALLAVLVIVALATGCASSPTARWVQQREAVTTTQDVIVSLHEGGVIDDDDVRTVGPWVVMARRQVNAAYAYLPDGGPEFNNLLGQAREWIAVAKVVLRQEQDLDPD